MLNEFVYCPRLFFYEFVEGVFVENADTLRGAAVHRRVDSGTGKLPSPDAGSPAGTQLQDAEDPTSTSSVDVIHSRSITLSSTRLGVIAKLDLVEIHPPGRDPQPDLFAPRVVVPVDYKAGAPRQGESSADLWPADRMQLGLQILILRDNGYACDHGLIYYKTTRQRVRLDMTADLEKWIQEQIREARHCASGPIPAPLSASPKCVRCSLAPVCLPDETELLVSQSAPDMSAADRDVTGTPPSPVGVQQRRPRRLSPRRLMAARDETRVLFLNTPGIHVGRRDRILTVKHPDRTDVEEVRISDVQHVSVFGNIQISTQAIQALCGAEVPVTWFSGGGWFYGLTRGHGLKNVFLRIKQFHHAWQPAFRLDLARRFVSGKIRNHRTLLMRNHIEPPATVLARLRQASLDAFEATSLDQLLGIEGAAASAYFSEFAGMLKAGTDITDKDAGARSSLSVFDFTRRNRRPPTDPINALLSLAYSLLAKDCTIAALAVGFDPYVGFYHQPRFGRPALALDLMEEFRPLVAESAVITAVNNRMLDERDFVSAGDAINLSPRGRKTFFTVYEQRMNSLLTHPVFDYKVSYRRAIELQARILARCLTEEIPEYIPLTTR